MGFPALRRSTDSPVYDVYDGKILELTLCGPQAALHSRYSAGVQDAHVTLPAARAGVSDRLLSWSVLMQRLALVLVLTLISTGNVFAADGAIEDFLGLWRNVDHNAEGVIRLHISP